MLCNVRKLLCIETLPRLLPSIYHKTKRPDKPRKNIDSLKSNKFTFYPIVRSFSKHFHKILFPLLLKSYSMFGKRKDQLD